MLNSPAQHISTPNTEPWPSAGTASPVCVQPGHGIRVGMAQGEAYRSDKSPVTPLCNVTVLRGPMGQEAEEDGSRG